MTLDDASCHVDAMVKKHIVRLDAADHAELTRLIEQGSERTQRRCHCLLLCDQGMTDSEVAAQVNYSVNGVANLRKRFCEGGITRAVIDAARVGAPNKFSPDQLLEIVALGMTPPPEGSQRWTIELLADEAAKRGIVEKISIGRVYDLLKEHNQLPQQSDPEKSE